MMKARLWSDMRRNAGGFQMVEKLEADSVVDPAAGTSCVNALTSVL